jgi:hypothetical protein
MFSGSGAILHKKNMYNMHIFPSIHFFYIFFGANKKKQLQNDRELQGTTGLAKI